ncbi:outer dense fiber protein 3-B-like isoform X2 [Gymnodraco acuticeps]|uniref:Outer dense fiber protein 3-B-like isoform X2 n=1 Tax=Gymnodraco acuticeps TaxID=8218 RepID=A0A6P8U3P9_GYMAC|nr:outer dense fiber protein 3-B-like isoform X2 [Gymnodraco acuticeps]
MQTLIPVPQPSLSQARENLVNAFPPRLLCLLACGGIGCRYEGPECWKLNQQVIRGIFSWVTDDIIAMARPSSHLIKKYKIIEQFQRLNIRSIINMQLPGEHAHCGPPIEPDSGFTYSPQTFMDNDIYFYNFGMQDFNASSLVGLIDGVKVLAFALREGRVAVHCHAGLGRSGASKHDPTKKTAPQCTFGSRHETKTEITPGPSYLIPSNITRVRPPAYSLYSRPKDPKLFQTPGPATYSPENAGKSVFHCAMSGRGKEISNIQTPGPASYSLPPLLGNNTVVKSTAPSFSLCGCNKHGNFYEDLSKISMTGRNFPPGVSTKTPGPGAYYPEMMTCTRSKAPSFSFGMRHSDGKS